MAYIFFDEFNSTFRFESIPSEKMPIEIFRDAGAHDLALAAGSVMGRENRDCALTLSLSL